MVTLADSERFQIFSVKSPSTFIRPPSVYDLLIFPKKKELDDNKQNVFLHSSPGPSRYCLI